MGLLKCVETTAVQSKQHLKHMTQHQSPCRDVMSWEVVCGWLDY